MKPVLSTCAASIAELRQDPSGILAAAEGAAVAILSDDEPTAYLIPAATYEWLMERIEDTELAETVRERQAQLHQAVDVELSQL